MILSSGKTSNDKQTARRRPTLPSVVYFVRRKLNISLGGRNMTSLPTGHIHAGKIITLARWICIKYNILMSHGVHYGNALWTGKWVRKTLFRLLGSHDRQIHWPALIKDGQHIHQLMKYLSSCPFKVGIDYTAWWSIHRQTTTTTTTTKPKRKKTTNWPLNCSPWTHQTLNTSTATKWLSRKTVGLTQNAPFSK